MLNFETSEVLEFHECLAVLERTLQRLDLLGAGIAAIHVNAAIEQLKGNIEAIELNELRGLGSELVRIAKDPQMLN